MFSNSSRAFRMSVSVALFGLLVAQSPALARAGAAGPGAAGPGGGAGAGNGAPASISDSSVQVLDVIPPNDRLPSRHAQIRRTRSGCPFEDPRCHKNVLD